MVAAPEPFQIYQLLPFYHFISNFAKSSLYLMDLLKWKVSESVKPSTQLNWAPKCQQIFEKLKALFTTKQVLNHPDENKKFIVQGDASDVATGRFILQEDKDSHLHPSTYV